MITIKEFLNTHIGRYIAVGGIVYLIELLVIALAQRFGLSTLTSVALSFWIGLVLSFILQKFVTFSDHRSHYRVVGLQLAALALLVLFNFCFTLLVTRLLTGIVWVGVSRTCALGITTLWNFYLYKIKIFKPTATVPID
jgi:putative flippase GtrA